MKEYSVKYWVSVPMASQDNYKYDNVQWQSWLITMINDQTYNDNAIHDLW
jgi:hypothetical protein